MNFIGADWWNEEYIATTNHTLINLYHLVLMKNHTFENCHLVFKFPYLFETTFISLSLNRNIHKTHLRSSFSNYDLFLCRNQVLFQNAPPLSSTDAPVGLLTGLISYFSSQFPSCTTLLIFLSPQSSHVRLWMRTHFSKDRPSIKT